MGFNSQSDRGRVSMVVITVVFKFSDNSTGGVGECLVEARDTSGQRKG